MNELVEKFKEIISIEIFCWGDWEPGNSYKLCAEECKKIAIDFKTYYMQQPKRIINLVELPDGISIEDFIRQHDELEFDKFIENYE